MRRRRKKYGNIFDGYSGEGDVKDINNDEGRRKERYQETPTNRTLSDGTPSGGYQRRGGTRGFGTMQQREKMIEKVRDECTETAMKRMH